MVSFVKIGSLFAELLTFEGGKVGCFLALLYTKMTFLATKTLIILVIAVDYFVQLTSVLHEKMY